MLGGYETPGAVLQFRPAHYLELRSGQGPTARRKVTSARVEVVLQCRACAHEAGRLEDVSNSTAGHVAPIVLDREQTHL